ncbi:hypothetical protein COHA_005862 [Chlorella ohadii]|uniref:Uncharacterized protein n=1 Tax=Chlorella ohadii TaxID=2649997 RepID=A0AAD5DU52_9CHLO|nr:hypothetical protein COHA_005862 [Chlorella ohadii]
MYRSAISMLGGAYPPYTSIAASLVNLNLQNANEALVAYQQSISYMRQYVAAAIVDYNTDLMNANVMSDYNAYRLAMQRYNATQEQAVRARNLEQALTLCHRMRSRLSDWRSGKDFGKAQPLQPHQAFNWIATIGTTCLTTEYLLWKLHPESKLTNEDLVRHELAEWQSLASAAVRDLYAGANGQLPTAATELRLSGSTSTIRQLRLAAFSESNGPRTLAVRCYPHHNFLDLWAYEVWDSIAHTKFTATYLEGGRCAGSSTIGMCPIPQPRYSYDPVPNSHQAWKYYFGVFDSFKARAANELMIKLDPYMEMVWAWQYVVTPKMGPQAHTLHMGPFGMRDSSDRAVEPKFQTQPRDRFPEFKWVDARGWAGGKKFEVGEAGRRCGGKGPMDCASFDSDRLLPKSAFEDTRVGRRIRFFNLRGTWGGEQGALVQLLPIYVAYRTPPQA